MRLCCSGSQSPEKRMAIVFGLLFAILGLVILDNFWGNNKGQDIGAMITRIAGGGVVILYCLGTAGAALMSRWVSTD